MGIPWFDLAMLFILLVTPVQDPPHPVAETQTAEEMHANQIRNAEEARAGWVNTSQDSEIRF